MVICCKSKRLKEALVVHYFGGVGNTNLFKPDSIWITIHDGTPPADDDLASSLLTNGTAQFGVPQPINFSFDSTRPGVLLSNEVLAGKTGVDNAVSIEFFVLWGTKDFTGSSPQIFPLYILKKETEVFDFNQKDGVILRCEVLEEDKLLQTAVNLLSFLLLPGSGVNDLARPVDWQVTIHDRSHFDEVVADLNLPSPLYQNLGATIAYNYYHHTPVPLELYTNSQYRFVDSVAANNLLVDGDFYARTQGDLTSTIFTSDRDSNGKKIAILWGITITGEVLPLQAHVEGDSPSNLFNGRLYIFEIAQNFSNSEFGVCEAPIVIGNSGGPAPPSDVVYGLNVRRRQFGSLFYNSIVVGWDIIPYEKYNRNSFSINGISEINGRVVYFVVVAAIHDLSGFVSLYANIYWTKESSTITDQNYNLDNNYQRFLFNVDFNQVNPATNDRVYLETHWAFRHNHFIDLSETKKGLIYQGEFSLDGQNYQLSTNTEQRLFAVTIDETGTVQESSMVVPNDVRLKYHSHQGTQVIMSTEGAGAAGFVLNWFALGMTITNTPNPANPSQDVSDPTLFYKDGVLASLEQTGGKYYLKNEITGSTTEVGLNLNLNITQAYFTSVVHNRREFLVFVEDTIDPGLSTETKELHLLIYNPEFTLLRTIYLKYETFREFGLIDEYDYTTLNFLGSSQGNPVAVWANNTYWGLHQKNLVHANFTAIEFKIVGIDPITQVEGNAPDKQYIGSYIDNTAHFHDPYPRPWHQTTAWYGRVNVREWTIMAAVDLIFVSHEPYDDQVIYPYIEKYFPFHGVYLEPARKLFIVGSEYFNLASVGVWASVLAVTDINGLLVLLAAIDASDGSNQNTSTVTSSQYIFYKETAVGSNQFEAFADLGEIEYFAGGNPTITNFYYGKEPLMLQFVDLTPDLKGLFFGGRSANFINNGQYFYNARTATIDNNFQVVENETVIPLASNDYEAIFVALQNSIDNDVTLEVWDGISHFDAGRAADFGFEHFTLNSQGMNLAAYELDSPGVLHHNGVTFFRSSSNSGLVLSTQPPTITLNLTQYMQTNYDPPEIRYRSFRYHYSVKNRNEVIGFLHYDEYDSTTSSYINDRMRCVIVDSSLNVLQVFDVDYNTMTPFISDPTQYFWTKIAQFYNGKYYFVDGYFSPRYLWGLDPATGLIAPGTISPDLTDKYISNFHITAGGELIAVHPMSLDQYNTPDAHQIIRVQL